MTWKPSGGCVLCGALFSWTAPGERGIEQGWYRHSEPTARGPRCSDRNACKNRCDIANHEVENAPSPTFEFEQ